MRKGRAAGHDRATLGENRQYRLGRRESGVRPSESLCRLKVGDDRTDAHLAQEAGPSNIQVNVVCPGPVAGERMQRVIHERATELGRPAAEVEQFYVGDTALKRMVTEEDVAALVAFLASAEADNITGQAIDVSAGHSL